MASFEASGEAGGTGLSKHIRALGISETYDLAGFGEAQVRRDPPPPQSRVDSREREERKGKERKGSFLVLFGVL